MQTQMDAQYIGDIRRLYNREKPEWYGGNEGLGVIFAYELDQTIIDLIKKLDARVISNRKHRIDLKINDQLWVVYPLETRYHGIRAAKALMDIRIPKDYIQLYICPALHHYCYEVDFF
jgi:hypothetical protein